jgi:hypothetical protein
MDENRLGNFRKKREKSKPLMRHTAREGDNIKTEVKEVVLDLWT